MRVLGTWVRPDDPTEWEVRQALLPDRITPIHPGTLRDAEYAFLYENDWTVTRAAERSFLTRLDVSGPQSNVRAAPVLLLCGKAFGGSTSPCFRPGGRYELRVAVEGRPPAVHPFRVERRNRVLGLGIGLALLTAFLGLSAG